MKRCERSNGLDTALYKNYLYLKLPLSGRDSISKNAEQFSFRNIGDDSRWNILFRVSLDYRM